jgi:hypothetical protein
MHGNRSSFWSMLIGDSFCIWYISSNNWWKPELKLLGLRPSGFVKRGSTLKADADSPWELNSGPLFLPTATPSSMYFSQQIGGLSKLALRRCRWSNNN